MSEKIAIPEKSGLKTVIVGGVAGGASAAARLRRLSESAHIVIFERSGFVSYANCGLPYFVGGAIESEAALTLQTPESFWRRFQIDVRVGHEVTAIHRDKKTVTVRRLDTGETWEEPYDRLILAPGARPVRPQLPGMESSRIHTLRTVEDALALKARAEGASSAVVVGGGFIGVEAAENLRSKGLNVTLVEKQPQVLGQFDRDMVSYIHAHLRSKGIKLLLGCGVLGFEEIPLDAEIQINSERKTEHKKVIRVAVEGQPEALEADFAVLALGVVPDSYLAKEAGLVLGPRGSIAVNDRMQTSDPDIYAVGDAAAVTHAVTGEKALISLAGPANKQGRIAADNIAGLDSRYCGAAGASIVKIFDLTAASVGLNERAAKAAGIEYEKVILCPASHASYYPGGQSMVMKVLFEPTSGRLLGAQIIGREGVDKRLDVLATALQAGMRVTALKELDLAYAPPFSSAKDPVNMAGFISENVLTGKVHQFFVEDLPCLQRDDGVTLLDVRTDGEYRRGHAPGFETHIPLDSLRDNLHLLDKERPVYVMCQSGLRSYIACRILSQNGFECFNFAGGYGFYEANDRDRDLFSEYELKNFRTDCGIE